MDVNAVAAASDQMPTTRSVVVKMTADVNGYMGQMGVANDATNKFVETLVTLDKTLTKVKNTVGKGLMSAGALGFANMTAATIEAARFEQAFANLSKVVNKDTVGSMNALERSVRNLSTTFPTSANEVANLAAEISSLGVQGSKNITKFTETAIKMGAATELSGGQAVEAMTRLMRTFDVAPNKIDDLGGAIVKLANTSNTSAGQILDFSQTIQGVATTVGITLPQLIGMSAAITASGADSFAAANATSKVLLGMNNAVMLGGPQLSKYAQLIGVTTDQFKELVKSDPSAVFVAVAKAIKAQGSSALPILKVLGLDDTRSIKVLANIANASGDLNEKIKESQRLFKEGGAGVLSSAANKEFSTFFNQIKIFKNNIEEIFIRVGKPFLKPLEQGMKMANEVLHLFNLTLEKTTAAWQKVENAFAKIPGGRALLGTLKEVLTIMIALVPAILVAAGAITLFASEILALMFAIRAMKTVGPILEAFTKGLLGLRAGGALWRVMDMVPFINGLDKAGTKTKVIAQGFGLVGKAIRGTVGLAYDLVKALILGAGPIDRMKLALSNMLVPMRRLLNLIPGINFDPAKLQKQVAQTGLIQRTFAAAFGGISTMWSATTGRMATVWRSFMGSVSRSSVFSTMITQAQAFGAVLLAQAARFRTAMATVASPLVSSFAGLFAGLGEKFSNVVGGIGKKSASRVGTNVATNAATSATAGAAGGAAASGEMGAAAAAAFNPITIALGVATAGLGALWWASKRQRDAADKFVESVDAAGSAADALAVSLGKPKISVDPNSVTPGEGQPGYRAPGTAPGGVKIDDKSLIDLANATRGDQAKVRLLEGQYAQGAMRSGQELTDADMVSLRNTAQRAGLSVSAMDMLQKDIHKGSRYFESASFQQGYIQSLVASAFKNNKNSILENFNSKGTTANFRAIADSVLGNVTQYSGSKPNFDAVVANLGVLNREITKHQGDGAGKAFHEVLDEISASFGKDGEKNRLDFSGRGKYIRDIEGLIAWANHNAGAGGIQGNFARAVRDSRTELKSTSTSDIAVRDLVNKAEAVQNSIFAGIDTRAKALNAGMDNKYYASTQANNFGARDKAQQERILSQVDRSYGPTNQIKAYNDLLAARRRAADGMSEADQAQDANITALDNHIKKMGDTLNKTNSRQLDQKLATMGAADQMAYLDAQIKQTQKDMTLLANTPNTPQDAIDNLQERLDLYQDKLKAAQDKGLSDMRSLISLQKQQARLDKDHARAMEDARKQRDKALKSQQESFDQSVKQMKEQLANFKNPFERIQAEMTASAEDLVFNLKEQGTALLNYQSELGKLRGMGLSADAIHGLGLDDPNNAAQVDRLFHDLLVNPSLIKEINTEWGKRLSISKALATDPNNTAYSDLVKDFKKGQKEITDSYNESVAREKEAYNDQTKNISDQIRETTQTSADALKQLIHEGMTSSSSAVRSYAAGLKREFDKLNNVIATTRAALNKEATFKVDATGTKLWLDIEEKRSGKAGAPEGSTDKPKSSTPHTTPSPSTATPPKTPAPAPGPTPNPRPGPVAKPSLYRAASSTANYSNDYSTNYTGPITVQASSTRQFETDLQRKNRLKRLASA